MPTCLRRSFDAFFSNFISLLDYRIFEIILLFESMNA
jgi:hypothetical protein